METKVSDRAMRTARMFLGQPETETGNPMRPKMPRGLNHGNVKEFLKTPAGAEVIKGVRQRIQRG